jgi:hypothetical protein
MLKYFPTAKQGLPVRMTAMIHSLSLVFRAKCQCRSFARNQKLMMERMAFDSNPQSPAHEDRLERVRAV